MEESEKRRERLRAMREEAGAADAAAGGDDVADEASAMEESEKRRERLRAMREEAAAADAAGGDDVADEASVMVERSPPPPPPPPPSLLGSPCNPLDHRQSSSSSSEKRTPRFEYYTDPLAAFTGSHKKKNFRGSPIHGHGSSHSRSAGATPNYHGSPSAYSTPHQPPMPIWQPNFYPTLTPPGSYNTPSRGYNPASAFGSPQPSSAPHFYNNTGSYSPLFPAPPPPTSPSQRTTVNGNQDKQYSDSRARNYGGSPGGRGSPWPSLNRSPGGRSSPGGSRDSRVLGRSGSKNHQKSYKNENVTARDHPERFFKKSMLEDPWKHLAPVQLDSEAILTGNHPEPSNKNTFQGWLPKSISNKKQKATEVRVNMAASGPSLAESLAASLADAVSGQD